MAVVIDGRFDRINFVRPGERDEQFYCILI